MKKEKELLDFKEYVSNNYITYYNLIDHIICNYLAESNNSASGESQNVSDNEKSKKFCDCKAPTYRDSHMDHRCTACKSQSQ